MIADSRKANRKVALWLSRPFSPEADRYFLWLTMGLFVVLWSCHVWLGDDASLTFRVVLNFTEGHGMVWNWGERVQVFTHPAWFLLLSVTHVLSGGLFEPNILKYSSLFVSLALSMSALWLFLREMKGLQTGVVAVLLLALLSSQAFIDYTSSGLENPLSYFLVALISIRFFSARCDGFFFLACALLFLNRMDYALLLLPLCLYAWRSCGYKLSVVFPALSLCLLWLVFATWYFGHPLPNTFLAKGNIDAPVWNFVLQGFSYYIRTLTQDPVTLFVIFLALAACFYDVLCHRRISRFTAVGGGVVLYGLYLLWIGGDFMQGRFFSIPFVILLFCGIFYLKKENFNIDFLRFLHNRRRVLVFFLLIVMASCVSVTQRFKESFVLAKHLKYRKYQGIVNERRFELGQGWVGGWGGRVAFQSFQDFAPSLARLECCPGAINLRSNGSEYIVDTISLASPYLSRIPAKWFRIGHMGRAIPTDFEAWLVKEAILLPDPQTNAFFSDIRHVVRGNLFSWNRMKKIVKINLYDYNVEYFLKHNRRFSRLYPSLQQKVSFADLPSIDQKAWKNKKFRKHGAYNITQSVSIALEKRKIKKISFPVFNITEYTWSLYDGQKKVYEDFYKTDKRYSFHTFTLPKAMRVDRIVFVVDEGGKNRRIARPFLE